MSHHKFDDDNGISLVFYFSFFFLSLYYVSSFITFFEIECVCAFQLSIFIFFLLTKHKVSLFASFIAFNLKLMLFYLYHFLVLFSLLCCLEIVIIVTKKKKKYFDTKQINHLCFFFSF